LPGYSQFYSSMAIAFWYKDRFDIMLLLECVNLAFHSVDTGLHSLQPVCPVAWATPVYFWWQRTGTGYLTELQIYLPKPQYCSLAEKGLDDVARINPKPHKGKGRG
jgi:hypothetical protein